MAVVIRSQGHFNRSIFFSILTVGSLSLVSFGLTQQLLDINLLTASLIGLSSLLLFGLLLSVLVGRRLRRPLDKLSAEINHISSDVERSSQEFDQLSSRSAAILEASPAGLILLDQQFNLKEINQAAKKYLKFEEGDEISQLAASGEHLLERLSGRRSADGIVNLTEWVNQTGASKIKDYRLWRMVEVVINEQVTAFDMLVSFNKQASFGFELAICLIDRTDDYEAREKQVEFISLAAHELRGPITVMRGMIDIFKTELNDQLTDDSRELLTRLAIAGNQLSNYVNNILGASRVDQDTYGVQPVQTDWLELIKSASFELAIQAKAQHRLLELDLPDTLPPVSADPNTITHVISNLIDNAIKYSRTNGKITLSVAVHDGLIETSIQDAGIGIPKGLVGSLFTKFYRSHRSKKIVSGTGLGLYLCKSIVEAHGGTIWVRSTEGIGSNFTFSLPLYDANKQADEASDGLERSRHGWIKNHSMYRR